MKSIQEKGARRVAVASDASRQNSGTPQPGTAAGKWLAGKRQNPTPTQTRNPTVEHPKPDFWAPKTKLSSAQNQTFQHKAAAAWNACRTHLLAKLSVAACAGGPHTNG